MPIPDFTAAERKLSEFAESLGSGRRDRVVATLGEDGAVSVAAANALFDVISDIDTDWHLMVLGEEISYDAAARDRITALYREWAETGHALLALREAHPKSGREIAGLSQLEANLNEVRGILTPDDEFFNDAALIARQDEARDADRRGETIGFEELGD